MWNSLLAFFFWKAWTSSSFQKFLWWKSRNYSQQFSLESFFLRSIYLQLLIIELVYLMGVVFSLVWVVSVFFLPFLLAFFLADTTDSEHSRHVKENDCFVCFLLPPAHKHSFRSSKFLPLLFSQSISNYQADSWWDFFSSEFRILFLFFTDAIKLGVTDFDISKWHCEALRSYQFITVLLQGKRLNQLGLSKCSSTLKQFVSNTTIYHTYTTLPIGTTYHVFVCQNV